jgi:hypothetical protein
MSDQNIPDELSFEEAHGTSLPDELTFEQAHGTAAPKEPVSWGEWLEQGAADVAKSTGSGLVKGAVALPGIAGDIEQLGRAGLRYAGADVSPDSFITNSEDMKRHAHDWVPALDPALEYKPQTTAGEYAQTIGEFAPAVLAGPTKGVIAAGRAAPRALVESIAPTSRKLVTQAAVPAVASEGAGQATEGTWLEPYTRVGAAIAGHAGAEGVSSFFNSTGRAQNAIRNATPNITHADIDAAEKLVADAKAMGIDLTRAEALQHVTGGATGLGDTQRIAESTGNMMPFFAQRPQQVEGAARNVFDTVSQPAERPAMLGPEASKAATSEVRRAEKAVTKESKPYYEAAGPTRVPEAAVDSAISKIDAMKANDTTGLLHPELDRLKKQLEGSGDIENLDRIRKNIRDRMALPKGTADALDKEMGAKLSGIMKPIETAMDKASKDFVQARKIHADASNKILAPLLAGPIGRLAAKDATTKQAIEALFPPSPIAGSEREIADAVTRLGAKNPALARQLVRAHLDTAFNEARKDLLSGKNQAGGAKFAVRVAANPQQEANLYAALDALHGLDGVADGVRRFMDVMRATGQRQAIGSKTAFNQEALKGLTTGSLGAETIMTGGTGLPRALRDRFDRWAIGANTDELSRLLTDPKAAAKFRELAVAEPDSQRWRSIFKSLLQMSGRQSRVLPQTQAHGSVTFNESGQDHERTGRASGGAVGRMETAAKRAQQAISRETTPLMDQSDEVVANALRIASGR